MKKLIKIRTVIQVFFFILVVLITLAHTLAESGITIPFVANASVHAICPFGGVVSIYQYITSGTYVQKIHDSSLVLMWIVFILTIGFGPVFCGWICPLGSIQEWVSVIGRRVFKNRFNNLIPYSYDRYLRYARYMVLAWVVYMTAMTGKLVFNEVDPYSALFHLWSDEIAIGGLAILGITLLLSLVMERPWCKYACPYGALLGISNLFRIFKIRRNSGTCISCNKCSRTCPMNIRVADKSAVLDHQCISCLKCTSEEACPVVNTVEYKALETETKLKVKKGAMGFILMVAVLGGIGASAAMNLWNTTSSKVPTTIQTGSFEGQYDPSDIRGSYTFKDVESSFGVPVAILAEAFAVTDSQNPEGFQLKSLESMYESLAADGIEIGTGSVRLFVGLYTGLPIELDGSYLPKQAADTLLAKGGLSQEQLEYINAHSVDISSSQVDGTDMTAAAPETVAESESAAAAEVQSTAEALPQDQIKVEASEEKTVKGKTTFAELMDWGISKDKIEEIIRGEIPAPGMTVKDYCSQNGIEFSSIKDTMNGLLQ